MVKIIQEQISLKKFYSCKTYPNCGFHRRHKSFAQIWAVLPPNSGGKIQMQLLTKVTSYKFQKRRSFHIFLGLDLPCKENFW